jgi:hypothetical protein
LDFAVSEVVQVEHLSMKSVQRGESTMSLLVSMAVIFGFLVWLLSDYMPADAEDLQAVISLAAPSPDAKSALATALKETPNPNRTELRHMRSRVNEIIVTETARVVTGDKTLETPSERNAANERLGAARLAAIESKAWSEMSGEERAAFLASKSYVVAAIFAFLGLTLFGWRTISQTERGY